MPVWERPDAFRRNTEYHWYLRGLGGVEMSWRTVVRKEIEPKTHWRLFLQKTAIQDPFNMTGGSGGWPTSNMLFCISVGRITKSITCGGGTGRSDEKGQGRAAPRDGRCAEMLWQKLSQKRFKTHKKREKRRTLLKHSFSEMNPWQEVKRGQS